MVSYTYDAWGNPTSCTGSLAGTIGQKNPFRYRGYYYDTESGLYYLNSRYYDPEVGRFINADGYIQTPTDSLLSSNTFAYCENNPVNKVDLTGDFALTATLGGIALWKIGVALAGAVAVVAAANKIRKNRPTITIIKVTAKPNVEEEEVAAEVVVPKPRRDPTHHIVAKLDHRADDSRDILEDVGINPKTDPRNLVVLPYNYHVHLHTDAYHEYVYNRLKLVEGDYDLVVATLASLKAEILLYSTLGIRWD